MKIKTSNQDATSEKFSKILYPPRPKSKVLSTQLSFYERTGSWLVQRKFNGVRTLINIAPDKKINFLSRHGDVHKKWVPTSSLIDEISSLNIEEGKEYWLDCELLYEKTTNPNYKNKIIVFDVLQAGRYLFGSPTLLERYNMLVEICRNPTKLEPTFGIALQVSENFWLAENFRNNFLLHYEELIALDEIEGLVLKKFKSTLNHSGLSEYEVGWQIRCRKPHKNYNF